MARVVSWLLVVCALAVPCLAEQVRVLPEDGGKYSLTIAGDARDAHFAKLCGWFRSTLAVVRDQCHYTELRSDSAMYRERYRGTFHTLPAVRLQDAQGRIVYQASGGNIPASDAQLGEAINKRLCPDGKCLPLRRRDERKPEDDKPPQETPIAPIVQPLAEPAPDTTEPATPVGLLIVVGIAAALGSIALQWKRNGG